MIAAMVSRASSTEDATYYVRKGYQYTIETTMARPITTDVATPKMILNVTTNKELKQVFGDDTRIEYDPMEHNWSGLKAIGLVQTESGGRCTGTMVGRRLMLTALHCVQWPTSDGDVEGLTFTPAYYDGNAPFGVANGVWFYRTSVINHDGDNFIFHAETAFDYLLVVLDVDFYYKTGYMGHKTYSKDWDGGSYWYHVGYPGGMTNGERPVFSIDGVVLSAKEHLNTASFATSSYRTGYELQVKIDTEPGHSGGPIFAWFADEEMPRIVGVDSTGSPELNRFAGGPALTALIRRPNEDGYY